MPEPLKNLFNEALISSLAACLKTSYGEFDVEAFQEKVFAAGWKQKELKQRMEHISVMMHEHLPGNYPQAIEILKPVSSNFSGLEHMIFPAYVELFGMGDFEISMSALEYFTPNSSSEFAIRPFIKQAPEKTMQQMSVWAESDDAHVRRLASEGCRPRLPWAMALPLFKQDARPVLKILDKLMFDESQYVRRSVANNLNDISKDHPDVVINIAKNFLGKNMDTDRLVKHACRTLLKQGEPQILKVFGFKKPHHIKITDFVVQDAVYIGDKLNFSFNLLTEESCLGKLRIEYAIDFMKNNGRQKRKIFQISESENTRQQKEISKQHSFKLISTRKYYPGAHGLAIIVNGRELTNAMFQLRVKS